MWHPSIFVVVLSRVPTAGLVPESAGAGVAVDDVGHPPADRGRDGGADGGGVRAALG